MLTVSLVRQRSIDRRKIRVTRARSHVERPVGVILSNLASCERAPVTEETLCYQGVTQPSVTLPLLLTTAVLPP